MACCWILVLALAAPALGLPMLGVPVYDVIDKTNSHQVPQEPVDFSHLVVTTTASPAPSEDDVVRLDSSKERSRFLITLLMLQSLHDKSQGAHHTNPKLERQLLADEEVMQEVLKLYETTQETKGKHYIKIPPKLMRKMKRKMKELLTE